MSASSKDTRQISRLVIDPSDANRVYVGALGGGSGQPRWPSRFRSHYPAGSSESGYFAVDPRDPDLVYAISYYGSVFRWDRRRSLSQDVSP